MLFSVEQAFVGRDEIRAPLKTPACEAKQSLNSQFNKHFAALPPNLTGVVVKGATSHYLLSFWKANFLHQNSKNNGPAFLCKTIKYFGIETFSDMGWNLKKLGQHLISSCNVYAGKKHQKIYGYCSLMKFVRYLLHKSCRVLCVGL